MPIIHLQTQIKAPKRIVFDLARSIDLHEISAKQTKEQAVFGTVTGLIELGESVTWKARHFGIWHRLTSKITMFDAPDFFTDEMVKGPFKSFVHEHRFITRNDTTILIDIFDYQSPFGLLGKVADIIFLKWYMIRFLIKRNKVIKHYAETDKWKSILKTN